FAVQRVETIEQANNEGSQYQHDCRHVIRRFDSSSRFCRIEQQHCPAAFGQPNCADEETEQHNNRNEYRRDVDRTVLPKFSPYRPIEWPRRGSVAGIVDPGRFGHSVRCSIHLATPTWSACRAGIPELRDEGAPIIATNKSAM